MFDIGHDDHCQCAACEKMKELEDKDNIVIQFEQNALQIEKGSLDSDEIVELIREFRREIEELEEDGKEEEKSGMFR